MRRRQGRITSLNDINDIADNINIVKIKKFGSKADFISDEEKNIKISDMTVGHLHKLLNNSNYKSKNILLNNFFGKNGYSSFSNEIDFYKNNLLQYSLNEFLKTKSLKLFSEFPTDSSNSCTPLKVQVQCDTDKFFSIYSEATILYKGKDDSKLVIDFNIDKFGGIVYLEIYSSDNAEKIWKEWSEFSIKNNFYKNKKIDANCNFLKTNLNIGWDDVILEENTIKIIKNNISDIFNIKDLLKKNNISMKRGIILSGTPGCVIKGTKIKVRKKKEGENHKIVTII